MAYNITSLITTKELALYEKHLSICLRTNGLSFSVLSQKGTLLTAGDVEMTFSSNFSQLSNEIKSLLEELHLSPFDFTSTTLVVPTEQAVWIPESLYTEGSERQYLSVMTDIKMGKGVYSDYHPLLKSYVVFSADTTIVTSFKVAIPNIYITCIHAKMVNEVLMQRSQSHPVVVLNLRENIVDVAAYGTDGFLLGNSYEFKNNNELLYTALNVMKQLNLETPDMELLLCGAVDRDIYAGLVNYFPNVDLYTGYPVNYVNPEFQQYPTYRNALILNY
ncbi:MAG: DUF3822 family protein [Bacteroidales bacterium]|nr:DUF3822 family protein [Bacteroidales bacterium]